MFGRRSDATLVRDVPYLRRFMPFVSPRRNESLVYFKMDILVDRAYELLGELNEGVPSEQRVTMFHLLLRSMVLAIHDRPGLNRFTAGGRLWQRKGLWVTFSAKQRMKDGSPITTVKREFPEGESLEDMVRGVLEVLEARRAGQEVRSDKEMRLALLFPSWIIRLGVLAYRAIDSLGLLPRSVIDEDPLYATLFVANLGSVGLEAAYHHLWEYGTCPMFGVVGRVRKREDGRRCVTVKYSFDERINDGLYAAIGLRAVKRRMENPEMLR